MADINMLAGKTLTRDRRAPRPGGPSLADKQRWFIGPKFTRLSAAGVVEIERMFTEGLSDAQIGRLMGMTASAAWARRRRWNHCQRQGGVTP